MRHRTSPRLRAVLLALVFALTLASAPAALAADNFEGDLVPDGTARSSVVTYEPFIDGLWYSAVQWADSRWSIFLAPLPTLCASPSQANQSLFTDPTLANVVAFAAGDNVNTGAHASGDYCWISVKKSWWNYRRNTQIPKGGSAMRTALYEICHVAVHERGHNWGLPHHPTDPYSMPMGAKSAGTGAEQFWSVCQPWVDARMAAVTG